MQICPRCGQMNIDESHQCAPLPLAAEQVTGVRSAISALVILVLSIGLFAATLVFTVLHQPASAAPVIIQTTLPTNAATSTVPDLTTPSASITPTAMPAQHSGGGNGAAHPTPTPPPPTTPPLPTAAPPTPTDTPQPTPTRLPQ